LLVYAATQHETGAVRVLLADDDAERAGAVARVLAADPGLTVLHLDPAMSLADAVATLAPDIVLVDMARPDRDALEGIRQVTAQAPRPIVLFVDQDDPAFMEEAIGAGVSSYNVMGLPPPDVKPILRAAIALFQQHEQSRVRLRAAEDKLRERATIDRAKAILIKVRRINEPEAYRWLRRQAMTRSRRIVDIAEEIVRAHEGQPA
jgi:two-component system, response regulator / RNA-binding antiterminator